MGGDDPGKSTRQLLIVVVVTQVALIVAFGVLLRAACQMQDIVRILCFSSGSPFCPPSSNTDPTTNEPNTPQTPTPPQQPPSNPGTNAGGGDNTGGGDNQGGGDNSPGEPPPIPPGGGGSGGGDPLPRPNGPHGPRKPGQGILSPKGEEVTNQNLDPTARRYQECIDRANLVKSHCLAAAGVGGENCLLTFVGKSNELCSAAIPAISPASLSSADLAKYRKRTCLRTEPEAACRQAIANAKTEEIRQECVGELMRGGPLWQKLVVDQGLLLDNRDKSFSVSCLRIQKNDVDLCIAELLSSLRDCAQKNRPRP